MKACTKGTRSKSRVPINSTTDEYPRFVLLLFSGLTLWGITGREDLQWFRGLVRR